MPSLFSGNLFSIILIILAGIALRYALWFSKDESPAMDGELDSLRDRNRALRDELDDERADNERLNDECEKVREECSALQSALTERDATIFQTRQASSENDRELSELREQCAHLTSRCEQLEAENAASEDAADSEAVTALTEEKSRLEVQVAELNTQLEAAQSKSTAEWENLIEAHDQNMQALEKVRSDNESLTERIVELESTHSESTNQVEQVTAERDQLLEELNQARKQSHELESAKLAAEGILAEARDQIELLTTESRLAEDLRNEQGQLKRSLHESAHRLRSVHEENESLASLVSESEGRIAQLQDTIEQQNRQLQHYVSEMTELGQRADERVAELRQIL